MDAAAVREEHRPSEDDIYQRSPSFEKARAIAVAIREADKLNLVDANRVLTALSLLKEFQRERGGEH